MVIIAKSPFFALLQVVIVLFACFSSPLASLVSDAEEYQLADCSAENHIPPKDILNENVTRARKTLLVTTLDGRFWSLDPDRNGYENWSEVLGNEPLLDSTIGNVQFSYRNVKFQLVPSLDGHLYKFNGEAVEPIPINAETLLKGEYHVGDNMVVTGGQESKTFSVDLMTGFKHYECGISGCLKSEDHHDNESSGVRLFVQRRNQAVRAIEPETGSESWKFKVGEFRVWLINKAQNCRVPTSAKEGIEHKPELNSDDIRVIVPEGYVSVIDPESKNVKWSKWFGSPIAGVWVVEDGHIKQVDLFSPKSLGFEESTEDVQPIIYLGGHLNQMYVQHSTTQRKLLRQLVSHSQENEQPLSIDQQNSLLQIEWKPRAATSPTPDLIPPIELSAEQIERGFYLFGKEPQCPEFKNHSSLEHNETISSDSINEVIIMSLWHWWKEVLAISIVIGVAINFVLSFLKRKVRSSVLDCAARIQAEDKAKRDSSQGTEEKVIPKPPLTLEISSSMPSSASTITQNSNISTGSSEKGFTSRYLSDFEHIRCLGKGGFGVVFEAKNKLDDCRYAIKRIRVPFKHDAREKVKREVKALAKLEHGGIVRFFYSWIEEPPEGWQEEEDRLFKLTEVTSRHCASDFSSELPTNSRLVCRSESAAMYSKSVFSDRVSGKESFVCSERTDSYVRFECSTEDAKDLKASGDNNDSGCSDEEKDQKRLGVVHDSKNVYFPKAYLYIQMQLCMKSTLKDWLCKHNSSRDKSVIMDIFRQIVDAVDYVHSNGLMHRDLKPSNIFFSMDGTVKVGDFGLVTAAADNNLRTPGDGDNVDMTAWSQLSPNHTDKVGTCLYMSPEQIIGVSYSNKVDIFSLGVILFELLVPFATEMERIVTLKSVREHRFPKRFTAEFPKEYSLLTDLLAVDPDRRPTAAEIKLNPIVSLETTDHTKSYRRRTLSSTLAED